MSEKSKIQIKGKDWTFEFTEPDSYPKVSGSPFAARNQDILLDALDRIRCHCEATELPSRSAIRNVISDAFVAWENS